MTRRVAITGIGLVTSLGYKISDVFNRVLACESGIHKVTSIDVSDCKIQIGGDIPDWNPTDYLSAKDMKRVDRFTQFAQVAGQDAITMSGLDFSQEQPHRCGVILGSGIGGLAEIEAQNLKLFQKGPERVSAMTVPKMMVNAASGNLSIDHGLTGPNQTVATACASATNAIGDAYRTVKYGWADIMLTGGTEAAVTRMALAAFTNIKALSSRNDEPHRASRPFDLDRDGFVFSEGAGILVFEELEHAKARGANILAEVVGYGASADAGHITQPHADGAGAAAAMANALQDAQLRPEQVDYINAHGTSTPLGDKAETLAIKRVYGDHAHRLSVSSTKSQLGHSLGASGGIELVLTVQALVQQVVPPTANLETPDPECDLDYTPLQPREKKLAFAMSNSFGFGGHNASVIVAAADRA